MEYGGLDDNDDDAIWSSLYGSEFNEDDDKEALLLAEDDLDSNGESLEDDYYHSAEEEEEEQKTITEEERKETSSTKIKNTTTTTKQQQQQRHENLNNVNKFFAHSRLSFIGRWRTRFIAIAAKYEHISHPITSSSSSSSSSFPERIVFHLDMDAFFASVSILKEKVDPTLPCCVCWKKDSSQPSNRQLAPPSHSEISSCNYVARTFGVKQGMSYKRAIALCPNLKSLPFCFEDYIRVSEIVYGYLFTSLTKQIVGKSCDECFLDVTPIVRARMETSTSRDVLLIASELAREVKDEVTKRTNVTCSIGVSTNCALAQLSTTRAKPNGVFCLLRNSDVVQFLDEMQDVCDLPYVGPHRGKVLRARGIHSVRQLQSVKVELLKEWFGPKIGECLHRVCFGDDPDSWEKRMARVDGEKRKSISVRKTWGVRANSKEEADAIVTNLCLALWERFTNEFPEQPKSSISRVTLTCLKAIPNQPDSHRKGAKDEGHGLCDVRSISAKLEGSELKAQFLHLFHELRVEPTDLRGVGLSFALKDEKQEAIGIAQFDHAAFSAKVASAMARSCAACSRERPCAGCVESNVDGLRLAIQLARTWLRGKDLVAKKRFVNFAVLDANAKYSTDGFSKSGGGMAYLRHAWGELLDE